MRTIADVTRLMTMSIADLLDDWFESPQVKGALAVNGVIGTWAGPYEPGTAYVMAHHSIGDVGDGHLGNWGFQEGGMGAVSSAIEPAARSHGAEIRTGARVARMLVAGGQASGRCAGQRRGDPRRVVVSTLHPRTAFLDQVGRENLPDDFVRDIEHWKTRSGVVKINLALAELPDFTADPGSNLQEHHTGSVEMAPTHGLHRAGVPGRPRGPAGRAPVQRRRDPHRVRQDARARRARTSCRCSPSGCRPTGTSEPHTAELEAYADRMIDCYNELAPNFKASILHRDIVGPYEMEHDYGLIGGNIFHGELSLEQLFHMRPAPGYADYRTPVAGLYYGSSATHAGGGVCGIPGWQAARAAIADRRAPSGPARSASSPGGHDAPLNSATNISRTPAPGLPAAGTAAGSGRPAPAPGPPPGPGHRPPGGRRPSRCRPPVPGPTPPRTGRPCSRCWRRAASPWSAPARGPAVSVSGWSARWPRARPAPADVPGQPAV